MFMLSSERWVGEKAGGYVGMDGWMDGLWDGWKDGCERTDLGCVYLCWQYIGKS